MKTCLSINKSLILALIFFYTLLILSPLIIMFLDSFLSKTGEFTLDVYKELLIDKRAWKIFFRTLVIGLCVALSATLIGITLAYFLEKTDIPFKKLFRTLCIFPLIIPSFFIAVGWINIFRKLLLNFNIYSIGGVIFVLTLAYFPLSTIILISGFRNIDYRLEEASQLTSTKRKSFKKIVFPLLFPYLLTSFIITLILFFSEYATIEILRINTYSTQTYIQFSSFHNYAKATATSLPVLLFTFILVLTMGKIMSKRPYVSLTGSYKKGNLDKLHNFRIIAVLFIIGVLFLSVGVPIIGLVKQAGHIKNYLSVFRTSVTEILLSLFLSFIGASLGVILCLPISYALERTKGMLRNTLNVITLVPFAIPGIVVGMGLIKLWNRAYTMVIYSSIICVILGYLIRFSPYGIRIISSAIKTYDKQLEESAQLIPTSNLMRFYKVRLPLISSSLIITWIISFIFCMKELPTTLLVIPPGEMTLPIKIEILMHIGDKQTLSALCLIYIFITAGIILLLLPFIKFRIKNA